MQEWPGRRLDYSIVEANANAEAIMCGRTPRLVVEGNRDLADSAQGLLALLRSSSDIWLPRMTTKKTMVVDTAKKAQINPNIKAMSGVIAKVGKNGHFVTTKADHCFLLPHIPFNNLDSLVVATA